jgi:hypothetical protein
MAQMYPGTPFRADISGANAGTEFQTTKMSSSMGCHPISGHFALVCVGQQKKSPMPLACSKMPPIFVLVKFDQVSHNPLPLL